ncbi:MAG: ATP synthase F0 subunit B [Opitutales bacterium]|nr:ATP synthase F0 subunit B [Opitutales bacterium]|tara:strand:+ start:360 stop:911 length:552 start_codon:yes stop_codon:yes gene_type:complete
MIQILSSAGGLEETAQHISETFGVDWHLLVAQAINFAIVAFLIWKFAFKGILSSVKEREDQIADSLKNADKIKLQLEETERKQEETLKDASIEAQKTVSQAREQAKAHLETQREEAEKQAEDIITKAREAMKLEKQRVLEEAREEIARLVVMTTSKVLGRELGEEESTRFSEAAAREAKLSSN